MNNQQFRKLVLDTPARQAGISDGGNTGSATTARNGATPSLGSRMRSSIPMTPRSIAGYSSSNDFARQLAERNAGTQSPKKFRSSAAPKGSKLAEGYTDRAKLREQQEEDEKAARVKALEEMWKLQQIDEETFKKLRDEIVGGDVGSTHLVKGLDFKLLERVRRGEDVLNSVTAEEDLDEEDVEDEFERLADREVVAVQKEKEKKKGEMAPPSLLPLNRKRNRDQILAEMKAARLAAKEATQPALGSKFKKVGAPRSSSRIETDSKGREVLITVDEAGNEKRKVRKVQVEPEDKKLELLMPDKDAKPLGMEVPEIPQLEEEDEDINIFDDVGDDYDPLAGLDDDDDSDAEAEKNTDIPEKATEPSGDMPPPPLRPKTSSASRNYFNETKSEPEPSASSKAMSDPTILAALKKASTLAPIAQEAKSEEEKAREEKRRKMLMQDDRDAQDMDMGFGGSRFEDGEDEGEDQIKLSEWGGNDDGEEGGKKKERKRGPKKRKGDKNSAADVLGVLERRKKDDA